MVPKTRCWSGWCIASDGRKHTSLSRSLCKRSPCWLSEVNYALVCLLLGRQPGAIRAARKAGASWQQVALAIGTTAEQACVDYLAHHEHTTTNPLATSSTTAHEC